MSPHTSPELANRPEMFFSGSKCFSGSKSFPLFRAGLTKKIPTGKITKQSLNRVLKDLIKLDAIIFKRDDQDTRIKRVFLNEKGKKIFDEIFEIQKKRIYNALLNSNSEEVLNFDSVLNRIING